MKWHQKFVYAVILMMLIFLVLFLVTAFLFPNADPFEYEPVTPLPTLDSFSQHL